MRPIGARIRQACEIAEALGGCNYRQAHERLGEKHASNASKYLARAVAHRLMAVDMTVRPARFTVVEGWRDILDGVAARPAAKKEKAPRGIPKVCSFVFQLGA